MAGVYLSFPFCAQKCTFCNFASGVFPKELEERYLCALAAEIRGFAWPWTPETVYLGGGTPSRIPADALGEVLGRIPGRPWCEATIEAAPGTVTPERVDLWVRCGINRVSLGVQSFVERELARTGRRHTPAVVEHEAALLRSAGIPNFNVDLIAGLPWQTEESWEVSLDWVERLEPPHVSVYMLEVDGDSRLGGEMLRHGTRFGAAETPDEDLVARLYERAVERLERAGIPRYEISNFARPGWESAHNLKYWRLEPYAGFGADAHSFSGRTPIEETAEAAEGAEREQTGSAARTGDHFHPSGALSPDRRAGPDATTDSGLRRQNAESPAEYVAAMETRGDACVETTEASPGERLFVGLRLSEGVRLLPGDLERHGAAIARFTEAGLLELGGERLRLTPRGVLLSNEVFQEFL